MPAVPCRACKVLAPGGEVAVLGPSETWTEWHLCGRCWGLMVVGLRSRVGEAALDPFVDLRGLRLRPSKVQLAIREGLRTVGRVSSPRENGRHKLLAQEQSVLADLETIIREVEESARGREPVETWRQLRTRISILRDKVKTVRRAYAHLRT